MRSWFELEADTVAEVVVGDPHASDLDSDWDRAGVVDGEDVVFAVEVRRPFVNVGHRYINQRRIVLQ